MQEPETAKGRPEGVREMLAAHANGMEGLLTFLNRLGRFGMQADAPPVLRPVNRGA